MNSSDSGRPLVALSALPVGGQGVVHSLHGGHEFRSRVANLGFTPGAPLKVLQNAGHGPVLVSVRDTLVALGRSEASKIVVQNQAPPTPEDSLHSDESTNFGRLSRRWHWHRHVL
jgi:ferrous iron transport protein A